MLGAVRSKRARFRDGSLETETAEDILKTVCKKRSMPSTLVGITSYIKTTLMNGKQFQRKNQNVPPKKESKGLWIGRITDDLFTKFVNRQVSINPSSVSHNRLRSIVRVLNKKRIRLVASQVPVFCSKTGIKTHLDAVGIRNHSIVVIELKTTQHTKIHHGKLYNEPCARTPVLKNGFKNTEFHHHMLQTGFGMMCVRNMTKNKCHVTGIVVVSQTNNCDTYDVPAMYSEMKHFLIKPFFASTKMCKKRPRKTGRPKVDVANSMISFPEYDPRIFPVCKKFNIQNLRVEFCHTQGKIATFSCNKKVGAIMCFSKPPTHKLRVLAKKYLMKSVKCIFKDQSKITISLYCVLHPNEKKKTWDIAFL